MKLKLNTMFTGTLSASSGVNALIDEHGSPIEGTQHCHVSITPPHNHSLEINLSPIYLFTEWFIKPIDRWLWRKNIIINKFGITARELEKRFRDAGKVIEEKEVKK